MSRTFNQSEPRKKVTRFIDQSLLQKFFDAQERGRKAFKGLKEIKENRKGDAEDFKKKNLKDLKVGRFIQNRSFSKSLKDKLERIENLRANNRFKEARKIELGLNEALKKQLSVIRKLEKGTK